MRSRMENTKLHSALMTARVVWAMGYLRSRADLAILSARDGEPRFAFLDSVLRNIPSTIGRDDSAIQSA